MVDWIGNISVVFVMERSKYHRTMFFIAAIWNWALAISFLILPRIDIGLFSLAGDVPAPPTLLWFDSFMGLVFAFGIGFYLVSRNVEKNHGLIAMASFEKVWVFIIGLYYFLIAQASLTLLLVVSGDLIFGILFIEDLLAIRKTN